MDKIEIFKKSTLVKIVECFIFDKLFGWLQLGFKSINTFVKANEKKS